MQKQDITTKTISVTDTDFPEMLRQLAQIPSQLHTRGNHQLLSNSPRVGIVGARKFTPYGREVTTDIAYLLGKAGVTVVSGLALGVDGIAHRACLDAGGSTIAVLPCGIDTIYPRSHLGLGNQILEQGSLLVSEYSNKELPMHHQFIERNRIIAALSDILVITEAAENSGSLHTARFALELGKTIMAVPGQINSPYSKGTNRLIQTGAIPILEAKDVLQQLGLKETEATAYLPENKAEAAILKQLEQSVWSHNELLTRTELDTPDFQTHLTMLELKGIIEVSSGIWRLK